MWTENLENKLSLQEEEHLRPHNQYTYSSTRQEPYVTNEAAIRPGKT